MSNSVTVFSNGIADFVRSYSIKKGEKLDISIPVKKSHVGDVLASLNIFGDVKLDSPPSFSPSNNNNLNLDIDTENVLYDLATKLSGCKVSVTLQTTEKATKGTLMGVHTQELVSDAIRSPEYSLIIITDDDKIIKYSFDDIEHITFADETVQSEISKSLQSNFQKIKPNSTFVNLTVVGGEKDSETQVQYTVPAAAWKISYRLTKIDNKFSLKGLAIVDNNTEEDWKDVMVSVVTGEPITFSTDLAESKTPARSHVNIVNDKAVAGFEVERGRSLSATRSAKSCSLESVPSVINCSMPINFGPAPLMEEITFGESALVGNSEVKEVGDFSIFKSKSPLTIASNRSAVIPVFDTELNESKSLLHYDEKQNQSRAYRCVQFKNETEHSLGRGVCTVYFDGVYSGSCILPATKKNENNLMPYALETGVRIFKNLKNTETNLSSIGIKDGSMITQKVYMNHWSYVFENSKDEEFEVYLDHLCDNSATLEVKVGDQLISLDKKLANGYRVKVCLAANSTTEVSVVDTKVNEENITLSINNLNWLFQYNGLLKDMEKFDAVIDLNKGITEINAKIKKANDKIGKIATKQNRLRENIKVCKEDENKSGWTKDLIDSETELTKLEEIDIPAHEAELVSLKKKLEDALKNLVVNYATE